MIMLNRQVHWPTTVDEAVDRMLAKLTDAEKDIVRTTQAADLDLLHFGLGTKIRSECGLWDENVDLLASCGAPKMHQDSASAVILRALWEKLRAA